MCVHSRRELRSSCRETASVSRNRIRGDRHLRKRVPRATIFAPEYRGVIFTQMLREAAAATAVAAALAKISPSQRKISRHSGLYDVSHVYNFARINDKFFAIGDDFYSSPRIRLFRSRTPKSWRDFRYHCLTPVHARSLLRLFYAYRESRVCFRNLSRAKYISR